MVINMVKKGEFDDIRITLSESVPGYRVTRTGIDGIVVRQKAEITTIVISFADISRQLREKFGENYDYYICNEGGNVTYEALAKLLMKAEVNVTSIEHVKGEVVTDAETGRTYTYEKDKYNYVLEFVNLKDVAQKLLETAERRFYGL